MDLLLIILIALAIAVAISVAVVVVQGKRRAGSVLAAPPSASSAERGES